MSFDDLSQLNEVTRAYLALFFTFVALFYTSRIVLLKHRDSQEKVFPGRKFCATWWNHMLFRVFRATIWMVCVWRYFFPSLDRYLGMFQPLQHICVISSGLILLALGFGFTAYVHLGLGNKWCSGIDPDGPKQLLQRGVYRWSRNPMFVGVLVAQVGFFLALPSLFSLVCLLVGAYVLHRQIGSEEQHLETVFGPQYRDYSNTVRRWI